MKIAFLCKRRPMARDLLTRPYGRFFYLPYHLARKGHQVTLLLLSYKKEPTCQLERDGMTWFSESLLPWGPSRYLAKAKALVDDIQPDWIVGFSDTYYGILAQCLGAAYRIRSSIDAYDNYESYIPWLKPLHYYWRRALAKATLVTTAGPNLAEYMGRSRPGQVISVVPMAADPIFQPMDKAVCRRQLGLPLGKKLVGYAGSLFKNRGIELLLQAITRLQISCPHVELVLSGRKEKSVQLPPQARWLGFLPDNKVPLLLNSLDALLVVNRASAFGHFSYPVKLYEAMRCGIPVVAAGVDGTRWILRQYPQFVAETVA
jgi:glycosyltransferase involved in cell wall biosynthesis